VIIYLLITLIPSLAISYFIAMYQEKSFERQYKIKAQWYANFHAMNIENFLGETVGRLEMLATSIKEEPINLVAVEKILKETQRKDPRFSGFYWANASGDLLISTTPTASMTNIGDQSYFQQAVKTEKTSISKAHIGLVTRRYVITIATPIEEHGNVKGVLLSSLRLDKIEVAIKNLLKDERIIVTDDRKQTLMKAGSIGSEFNFVKSSMDIAEVPWTITATIQAEDNLVFWRTFILSFIIILTISNILFLWVKYLLLRKNVKKEKEQTELHKLELIGNLAASTAHEIRNPLTGIKGLVKLLSEEYKDEKAQSYFKVIQSEIDRINAIVSELLVLGKPTAYTLKTYNVNDIVSEIEPIIHSEANYMNVEFSTRLASMDLPVSCVKDHLKQVVLNLAKNAFQAMPNGGKLSISLEKGMHSCIIRIADTGVGMQKDQVKQAFDPFYTLKKDGSGLGLTVCKRIIETYSGNISIQTTFNEGTLVEISLPLLSDQNTD
jgi:two-component system, sporulation sensor kinase D